ncbi:MAG: nucleoside phosphorylase [Actinomycetota bacterium]|nr:nucleoside phosphorylase [Actinomycetota bacterium]
MPYPNFPGKHAHDSLIEPAAYVAYLRDSGALGDFEPPDGVILCYDRALWGRVRKQARPAAWRLQLLDGPGGPVGVIGGFGIGAPAAAAVLEELIAHGVRRFASIGTAGGLQHDLSIGDVVLCERAVRDEGVSHHYAEPATHAHPSPALTEHLGRAITERGLPLRPGTSWTIDTPYRETRAEVEHYRAEGVLCVEMEAAALFTVAAHRGVDIASAFAISDVLAESWEPAMLHERTHAALDQLLDIALDLLAPS